MERLTDQQIERWSKRSPDVHDDYEAVPYILVAAEMACEIRQLRAMVKRLEEFALSLEHGHHPDQRKFGDELRNRMKGA